MSEHSNDGSNGAEAGQGKRTLKRKLTPKTLEVETSILQKQPKLKQETIQSLESELSEQESSEKQTKKKAFKTPLPDSVPGVVTLDGSFEESNGMLIKGTHYRIGRRIGTGAAGQIHLVRNEKSGEKLAVKLEPLDIKHPQLVQEWEIYKAFNQAPAVGIARAYDYGICATYRTLVMDLLGHTLEQVYEMCDRSFSLPTTLLIAIQLIDRMESLHSHGIIHRDIKPENLMIRTPLERGNTIYAVDFGVSKFYIDPVSHRHIPYKEGCTLTGTSRYMSINAHAGIEQSRRDDLEAVGYVLIYFLRGSLPWQGCRLPSAEARHKFIAAKKKAVRLEELCEGHPAAFVEYMRYVRTLGFSKTPDYDFLRNMFIALLKKDGYDRNSNMDWNNK